MSQSEDEEQDKTYTTVPWIADIEASVIKDLELEDGDGEKALLEVWCTLLEESQKEGNTHKAVNKAVTEVVNLRISAMQHDELEKAHARRAFMFPTPYDENFLYTMFQVLYVTVTRIQYDSPAQDHLVELLEHFRDRFPESFSGEAGSGELDFEKAKAVQTVISKFRSAMVDLERGVRMYSDEEVTKDPKQTSEWTNFEAFVARLCSSPKLAEYLPPESSDDERFTTYLYAIPAALERPERRQSPISTLQRCEEIIAANYIRLCGNKVKVLCSRESSNDRFDVHHWDMWKERLREIEATAGDDAELRRLASDAKQKMDSLDSATTHPNIESEDTTDSRRPK